MKVDIQTGVMKKLVETCVPGDIVRTRAANALFLIVGYGSSPSIGITVSHMCVPVIRLDNFQPDGLGKGAIVEVVENATLTGRLP